MQKPTAKASWRAEDSAVETMGSAVAGAGLADLPPGGGWPAAAAAAAAGGCRGARGHLRGGGGGRALRSANAGPAPHAAVVAEGPVDGEAGDVIEADDGGGGAVGGGGGGGGGRGGAGPAA